jgi:hypothetical protein
MLPCSDTWVVSMPPFVLHATKIIVYLVTASIGVIIGRATANALLLFLPIPAGAFFIIICIVAALLVVCVAPLEQRLLWRRWLSLSDADLKWIGRSSSALLTGSIAFPVTLGIVLGMLSLLVG